MHDLDRIFREAAEAGRQAATPLPAGRVRGVAARVRQVRAAVTGTVSVAVVLAVVVLVTTAGVPNTSPEYVETPTSTQPTTPRTPTIPPTSQTIPTSTPPTTEPPPAPILDGRLLTEAEVAAHSPRLSDDLGWEPDVEGETDATCRPEEAPGALERGHTRFIVEETALLALDQWVEVFATTTEATDRIAALRTFYGSCAEAQGDQVDLIQAFTMRGVGDLGFIVVMEEPLDEIAGLYVEVRAASTGRVVTWTAGTSAGQDYNGMPDPEAIVDAVERFCEVSGGSCATTPVLDETYPRDVVGLTAGVLMAYEVAGVFGDGWDLSLTSLLDPSGLLPSCPTDPDDGRLASVSASYESYPGVGGVRGWVVLYPSSEAATSVAAELQQCMADDPSNTPVDGLADAWLDLDGDISVLRSSGRRAIELVIPTTGWNPDLGDISALVELIELRLADEA